jgi:hypothetical protein
MDTFTQPDLVEFDNSDEQVWKPKAGSPTSLKGTVTERKTVTRQDGTDVELVKLNVAGQTWVVWASPAMLRQCVERDNPQPGDIWGVELQGSKPIGQGRSMDLYGAFHKAAGAQPSIASGPKDAPPVQDDDAPF